MAGELSEPAAVVELERCIASGNADACVRLFCVLDESQRRVLRPVAKTRYRELRRREQERLGPVPSQSGPVAVARLAILATGTWSEVRQQQLFPDSRALFFQMLRPTDEELQILRDRRPAWLDRWAEWLCDRQVLRYWPSLYELEREGLLTRPSQDGWILGFARFLGSDPHCLAVLRRDPRLLDAFWRLFEVENPRPSEELRPAWRAVLHELIAAGEVDRGRALDACLDALERDFHSLQEKWFQKLHAELAPQYDEIWSRGHRYLALISARAPGTVDVGLGALARLLDSDQRLPAASDAIAESLRPTLSARTQKAAKSGLGLLARLAEREASVGPLVGALALEALLHEAPAVQQQALDLFERYSDLADPEGHEAKTLRARLAELAGSVAPVHRQRVESLLETSAATPGTMAEQRAPAGDPRPSLATLEARSSRVDPCWRAATGLESALVAAREGRVPQSVEVCFDLAPRLDPNNILSPVTDLDDLLDLAHAAFEGKGAPDDLSRLADGISRLGTERPDDFALRTAVLRQRLLGEEPEEELSLWTLGQAQVEVGALLLAWIEPALYRGAVAAELRAMLPVQTFDSHIEGVRLEVGPSVETAMFVRLVLEIGARLGRGVTVPLLSLPSHRGGWLDPRVLVQRLVVLHQHGGEIGTTDATLALLRLAPEHRSAALAGLPELPGEPVAATRHALGASEVEIGGTESLWLAAARTRCPEGNDDWIAARFPRQGPGTAHHHCTSYRVANGELPLRPGRLRLVPHHQPDVGEAPPAELATVRWFWSDAQGHGPWTATLWPGRREPLYVHAANAMLSVPKGQFWGCRAFLDPLLDADEPL